mmetsp:Transcript_24016/g.60314  ORF Transcript_24016/g.60314 Transcript_24016/m.60314 type:complete len:649 (-) Transcript_24016:463-2409(-)
MALASDDKYGWTVLAYCLCIFFLVAFALYGILWQKFLAGKEALKMHVKQGTTEMFTTAKGSQGMWRIGWSFFAAAMGGWVITAPANFAVWGGWIAMMMYAIATGIPILLIAFLGRIVVEKYPDCCSLGDFVAWRFGPTMKIFTTLITLFNMCIFLLAEFTTVGALFSSFVGDINYPIIIVVGLLATAYTAYGGLLVSIVTDQAQTVLTLLIITIVWIYVAAEFRAPLEPGFGDLKEQLGPQFLGYSSIFTLPASLVCATVFSEAVWQRVWASEDKKALYGGAVIGFTAVTVCVFLCGLFGFIAAWGGLIDLDTADPNLYMFQVFKREQGAGMATVDSWIQMLVLILAVVMNESAVDSLLNGITSTISSQFFRGKEITYCRAVVFLICIPLVVIATRNYAVLQLFLISNMLCCCCAFPVFLGLFDTPNMKRHLTETVVLASCLLSIITATAYGIGVEGSWSRGAYMTWLGNGYAYDYFLVAVFAPVAWLIVFGVIAELLRQAGVNAPGVSDIAMQIPGFKALAGHWEEDLTDVGGPNDVAMTKQRALESESSSDTGANAAPAAPARPEGPAYTYGQPLGAPPQAPVPPQMPVGGSPAVLMASPPPFFGAVPMGGYGMPVPMGGAMPQYVPQGMPVGGGYVPQGGSVPPV